MDIIIGRKVEGENTLRVEPLVVSSRHCHVWLDRQSNTYYVEDLSSMNGTYVNGMLIKRMAVQPTDKILLGGPGGYETSVEKLLEAAQQPKEVVAPKVVKEEEKEKHVHSLAHFKTLYVDYQRDMAKFKSRVQLYSSMRIVPSMLISVLGVILAVKDNVALAIVSLVAVIACLIISSILIRKTDAKMKGRITRFQLTYVCPKTKRFYGDKSWEVLQNEGICLHCKDKFEE